MENKPELQCGLIMPIAPMFDYTADHWLEVKGIITQAVSQVTDFKFKTDIVSNSDGEIDVIHKRIVQNLYNADIVICDISGKNPNVLFELGMRLTFDKPTIIIKDDKTDFMFDTGLIEHINYPSDLRFNRILKFQAELAHAVSQTYKKSIEGTTYSTFLGSFGEFRVPALNQTHISDVQQLILDEISSVRKEVAMLKKESNNSRTYNFKNSTQQKLSQLIHSYLDFTDEVYEKPTNLVNSEKFRDHLAKNGFIPDRETIILSYSILKQYEDTLIRS